mmetsp:Transcript_7275/g.26793  ORF Transcript_7275/g.26793 Transcript_7275/m.26793 type:complete len:148 (+) Transcript_7275:963-1406(+)|eukprot:scaffold7637_cov430-Prasinococcus_capsulatus_cf.AAC.6
MSRLYASLLTPKLVMYTTDGVLCRKRETVAFSCAVSSFANDAGGAATDEVASEMQEARRAALAVFKPQLNTVPPGGPSPFSGFRTPLSFPCEAQAVTTQRPRQELGRIVELASLAASVVFTWEKDGTLTCAVKTLPCQRVAAARPVR